MNYKQKIEACGAGTRIDAVYLGAQRYPYNVMIQETVKQGLQDCVILDRRTPTDVIDYVVEHFNSFHAGSPTTFLQWRVILVCVCIYKFIRYALVEQEACCTYKT